MTYNLLLRKRFSFMMVLVLMFTLLLSACGGQSKTESKSSATNSEAKPADSAPAQTNGTQASPSTDNTSGAIPQVDMVIFTAPSLGAFLPPIIENQKLDIKNGIDIHFVERPPSAYNTEFASGQYPLGGSAALLSEALRMDRGVKVSYLFNLFDFWGTVVSSNQDIKTVKDLEGKNLAAAKSTTNFAMFQYFAMKSGADVSKIQVLNADTSALVTYAEANRADGVQMWEPAYSGLVNKQPEKFHQVHFGLDKWKEYTGTSNIPYLGVAAHQEWVESHKELIPKLYKTYMDAAEWVNANKEEAAKMIAAKIPGGDPKVIQGLIENKGNLGMNVMPAGEMADDIRSVFKAGLESKYLKNMPDDSIIYQGALK